MDLAVRNTPTPTTERTMDNLSQLKNVRSLAKVSGDNGKAYRSDRGLRKQRCQRVLEESIRMSLDL